MAFVAAGGVCGGRRGVAVTPSEVRSRVRVCAGRKGNRGQRVQPDRVAEIPSDVDLMGWEPPPIEEDEFAEIARTAAEAGDERKGRNIVALRVSRLTHTTTFFVYISGNSAPQLRAIANLVEDRIRERHNLKPRFGQPGNAASGWLLLDYGDMMVHVFSKEQRAYYQPEALWVNGETLDLSKVVSPESLRKPEVGRDEEFDDLELDDEDDIWSLS